MGRGGHRNLRELQAKFAFTGQDSGPAHRLPWGGKVGTFTLNRINPHYDIEPINRHGYTRTYPRLARQEQLQNRHARR